MQFMDQGDCAPDDRFNFRFYEVANPKFVENIIPNPTDTE